jgi:hypothetical protein
VMQVINNVDVRHHRVDTIPVPQRPMTAMHLRRRK